MDKQGNPRCNNGGVLTGEDDLAGAEDKFADWGRTVGRIDESKAPERSSQRDKHNGTLRSGDDAWIESNSSLELS
jgi:hypothetical protein